jgi:hypothetical protein
MSSAVDTAIKNLEDTAVKVATEEVMKYLALHVWAGFAYPVIGPIVSFFVSYVASILMERLDWVTYMVVQNWKVTNEGKSFIEAAEKLHQVEDSKDAEAIERARKEKEDAFRRLIGLAS